MNDLYGPVTDEEADQLAEWMMEWLEAAKAEFGGNDE